MISFFSTPYYNAIFVSAALLKTIRIQHYQTMGHRWDNSQAYNLVISHTILPIHNSPLGYDQWAPFIIWYVYSWKYCYYLIKTYLSMFIFLQVVIKDLVNSVILSSNCYAFIYTEDILFLVNIFKSLFYFIILTNLFLIKFQFLYRHQTQMNLTQIIPIPPLLRWSQILFDM